MTIAAPVRGRDADWQRIAHRQGHGVRVFDGAHLIHANYNADIDLTPEK